MTQNNNIPQGYKKTEIGIIPQEWEVKYLGDLLSRLANGLTYDVSITSGYPISRIETISSGEINYLKVGYIDNVSGCESYKMQKGDILYSHINSLAHVGKVAYYDGKQELYHGMNLLLMRANDKVDSNYLYAYLLTSQAKHIAQVIAKPAVNQASISTSDIRKIKLAVPPMEEQRKIAEILGVWDEAIEKQSRLIEKLELRKRALMQRLLTGRTRLPGFTTPWQKVKLGAICKEFVLRNTDDNNYIVLSCTKYNGLVSSLDYFGKQIFSDNLRTYKVVPKYHFAYATNHIEEGSIGYQGSYDYALISPMYTVFKADDTKVDNYFLYTLLKTPLLIYNYQSRIEGSIDRRGGLRWDAFAGIIIKLPSLPEQKAIAEVLTTADDEIATHRKKLDALRLQKRGLMQQLLTGKTRIKI
ncbi:MAG: restriction endonuclease subunit S [Alphaproteobacteria bacterium]|nr:restriction endonuclease subunit S [Alphaproteobacteria bacterium]MBQ6709621.1 restriction endonuclease subunit S [Bacteroidales bacterium]